MRYELTTLAFLSLMAGCSAVVDAGQYEQALDFEAYLTNMTAEFSDIPVLVTVIDDDGAVAARVVLEGLDDPGDGALARVFSAIDPRVEYDVLVIADEDGNGEFVENTEPTWYEPDVDLGVTTVFGGRDAAVTDADPPGIAGGDFVYTFENLSGAHGGQHFALAVFDYDLGRGVGAFSLRVIPDAPSFTVTIRGIIEEGHTYDVQFFANRAPDEDGDGLPDVRGLRGCGDTLDHCWRFNHTAEGPDLVESFTHSGPFDADLDAFQLVE
jgi:hypothetical protein